MHCEVHCEADLTEKTLKRKRFEMASTGVNKDIDAETIFTRVFSFSSPWSSWQNFSRKGVGHNLLATAWWVPEMTVVNAAVKVLSWMDSCCVADVTVHQVVCRGWRQSGSEDGIRAQIPDGRRGMVVHASRHYIRVLFCDLIVKFLLRPLSESAYCYWVPGSLCLSLSFPPIVRTLRNYEIWLRTSCLIPWYTA